MVIKEFVEKIEGEAELDFEFYKNKIVDAKITFPFERGIESILIDRSPLDALVITPRVCGICNHAHLIASVRAIENAAINSGLELEVPKKANILREFTLSCEIIQSHIKWLYLVALPQINKLLLINEGGYTLKASFASNIVLKALAVFAGQWPHSSYAVPGGVTCDPTYIDILEAKGLIDKLIRFLEVETLDLKIDDFLDSAFNIENLKGDFGLLLSRIFEAKLHDKGKSHGRFIAFDDISLYKIGKLKNGHYSSVCHKKINEYAQNQSKAKGVSYKEMCYEVGPLARLLISQNKIISNLNKNFSDSTLTRVYARVYELTLLLYNAKNMLNDISPKERSCVDFILPKDFQGDGIGSVEAARGSLIHEVSIKNSLIAKYNIITPTQWNLSMGTAKESGIAIEAMKGCKSTEDAKFIFRVFDVCSVCTTQ